MLSKHIANGGQTMMRRGTEGGDVERNVVDQLREQSQQINELDAMRRSLMLRASIDGITIRAIAEACGVSTGTVHNWIASARASHPVNTDGHAVPGPRG